MSAYGEQGMEEMMTWFNNNKSHLIANHSIRKENTMAYSAGDKVIQMSNNQRATVNWVDDGEAGVSYTDEPWYPGSMVVPITDLMTDEWEEQPPVRFQHPHQQVAAVREQLSPQVMSAKVLIGSEVHPVVEVESKVVDDPLLSILGG